MANLGERRRRTGFSWGWRAVTAACFVLIGALVAYIAMDEGGGRSAANGVAPSAFGTPPPPTARPMEGASAGDAGATIAPTAPATIDAPAPQATGVAVAGRPDEMAISHAWPREAFPDVPAAGAQPIDAYQSGGYAEIYLPADADLAVYAQALVQKGADLYVDVNHLKVLRLGEVEIQLILGDEPVVALCAEPAIAWTGARAAAYPLPEAGRLVAAEEGEQADVLTIRGASYGDLIAYLDLLARRGWRSDAAPSAAAGATMEAVYQKAGRTIAVDYYANSANFTLRMGSQPVKSDNQR